MHELSIAMALVKQLQEISRQHGGAQILTARIGIGPLAGVEGQLLAQAFPLAAEGTCAAHTRLILTQLPLRILCEACQQEADVAVNHLVCPTCGTWRTRLLSGDELLLTQVTLEEEDLPP